MAEELPVLIAALADEKARELEEASRVGRSVWVVLKWPPAEPGPHLLEVYTPSANTPLRLLAEPLGSSNQDGVALRVYPWEEPEPELAHVSEVAIAQDPLLGRTLAGGRFEIVSSIGEGSIGAVYQARHTGLGIVVALKVLHDAFQRDAEFCRRFYAEALALSRLDHANLVHIYDFGQEPDGLLYLAMAFVDGATLRGLQRHEKRFETTRIVSWMLQVCAGLAHAHARGLLHRDVKPDNVMIVTKNDNDGNSVETVKVLDFGFAIPPTISGEVAQRLAGTPVYMSPEQCLGQELDARSDVYACGIMMYELATGTVPFLARDSATIREMHIHTAAPLVSSLIADLDPRFERLVERCLSKSREDRPPSMQELRAELKILLVPDGAQVPASMKTSGSFDRPSLPALPAAPAAPVADWLESPQEGFARLMVTVETAETTVAERAADLLVKDSSAWLGGLVREREPKALARRLADLDGAVRVLAQRAEAKTLQTVVAVVAGLFERADEDTPSRAALAAIAGLLQDPKTLTPIATRLLALPSEADSRVACESLLRDGRVAGAYALYAARTQISPDQHVRVAFVTTMKSFGESALPVVRAALARILEGTLSGEHPGAVALAEDVLLSVPTAEDEVSGQLIVKYASSGLPNLCRAAARALPRVWADRASPVLLHLVHHEDESVRVAAVVGLAEIGAVDALAVARIAALVDGGHAQSPQLRAAIRAALQGASQSVTAESERVLERLGTA